jgi:Spy/CpxP family protein refolding chaperone
MKKFIVMGMMMALVLSLIFVNGSWAAPEHGHMMMEGRHMGMGCGPMWLLNKLDLTKQQMDQEDKILDQHKNDFKALHKKIDEAKKSLHEAVTEDKFDEQKIRAASKALATNMEEMAVVRGKMASEMRAILTPEQLEQLKQMRIEHQEKMKFKEKFMEMMEE